MAAKRIDLDVVTGRFIITPYELDMFIKTNDTVEFKEKKSRRFWIVFHGASPLKEKNISDKNPKSGLDPAVIEGAYPYAVAILSSKNNELFLQAHCPSIIVH